MASAPKIVSEESLTPEQMKALGIDAAGVPQVVGEEPLTPEQMQALGVEPEAPQYSPAGTYVEKVPGQDAMWPQPPSNEPPKQPYNPSWGERAWQGIKTAVTEGGPLGVSDETLYGSGKFQPAGEATFNAPTGNAFVDPYLSMMNRFAVQAPATALDVAGRAGTAVIRGLSGMAAGIASPNDPNTANRIERDVNVLGDTAALLMGANAPMPVKPRAMPGAWIDRATGSMGSGIKWLGGADPEDVAIVRQLADEGVHVSPAFAPELPKLRRYVDLARALGSDPTAKSATEYARNNAIQTLVKLGKTEDEARQLVNKLRAPGATTLEGSAEALSGAAENLQTGIDTRRGTAIADMTERRNRAMQTVDNEIGNTWKQFDEVRKSNNPENLSTDLPKTLMDVRQRMSKAFSQAYNDVLDPVADVRGDTTIANPAIADFLKYAPEDWKNSKLVEQVAEMANNGTASLPELQWIRNQLRNARGSPQLDTNFKTGPFAKFAGIVDDMINNPDAPTQWREAANELRAIDQKYATEMDVWRDRAAQQMYNDTKAGTAPEPAAIVETLNTKNEGPRRRRLLGLVTPEVRAQATSATLDKLVGDSLSMDTYGSGATGPRMVDPKAFMKNVMNLHKDGILQDYVGAQDANQILGLARQLAQRDGVIPINDTTLDGFRNALIYARKADDVIAKAVKDNPGKVLTDEVARIKKEMGDIDFTKLPEDIPDEKNPLQAFRNSRAALAATEALLDRHNVGDLKNVITTLGENSPEVQLLREETITHLLKPFLETDAKKRINPERAAASMHISDNTQKLLFPTLEPGELNMLGRKLRLIMGSSAQTMPAFAANTILGEPAFKMPPKGKWWNPEEYGRIAKQFTYGALAHAVTSPTFTRILTGELKSNRDVFTALTNSVDRFLNRNRAAVQRIGAPLAGGQNLQQPAPEPLAQPGEEITNESMGLPEFKKYATGGFVEAALPKTAEPAQDIQAQVDAVEDPNGTKDAVFIATGSPLPVNVPPNLIIVRRPEGHLLTTNIEKARLFQQTPKLTDRDMADILDYTEAKSDVTDPTVMQGVGPDGGVSVEMLTSRGNEGPTADRIMEQDPDAMVRAMAPQDAQLRRMGYAAGGPVAPDDLMPHFIQASSQTGVPVDYLLRVARQESNFNPRAVSPTGARGIMQVLPSTAAKPGYGMEGVDPNAMFDPATNILFGAKYLAARANANTGGKMDWSNPEMVAAALRSYNGPVNAGGDPNYVNAIMGGGGASGAPVQMAEGQPPMPGDEEIPQDDNLAMLMAAQPQDEEQPQDTQEAVGSIMPVVEAMIMSGNAKKAIALLVNAGLSLQEASKIVWSVKQNTSPRQLNSVA